MCLVTTVHLYSLSALLACREALWGGKHRGAVLVVEVFSSLVCVKICCAGPGSFSSPGRQKKGWAKPAPRKVIRESHASPLLRVPKGRRSLSEVGRLDVFDRVCLFWKLWDLNPSLKQHKVQVLGSRAGSLASPSIFPFCL